MLINQKYDYKNYEKITSSTGDRVYIVNGKKLPSVTTILSKTKDQTFLHEWRRRVGNEEAARITKVSTDAGTSMHKNLENYILKGEKPTGSVISQCMTNLIIKEVFNHVDEVYGLEAPLYCKGLYSGTTDIVFSHKGEITIGDFKNSRATKKEEWVEDYLMQSCAYKLAHDEMFNTDIKKCLIMLATHDGAYQQFELTGKKLQKYIDLWLLRLDKYYRYHH